MNKLELKEFINKFIELVENKGNRLKSNAEDFALGLKSSMEYAKIEVLIRDDYADLGLLVYELHKMGKDFEFVDFKDRFKSIDYKMEILKSLEKKADVFGQISNENLQGLSAREEDFIICPSCGEKNFIYVAYCKKCGREL